MAEQQANSETPLNQFLTHQRRAAEATAKALHALVPPDFRTHSAEARKEFLASFKVLIDGAASAVEREINKMRTDGQPSASNATDAAGSGNSDDDSSKRESTTGKTKVKVEVS